MASILDFEVMEWEKLFWFMKFLIPKMIIKDPQQDLLDELLNSVDLSMKWRKIRPSKPMIVFFFPRQATSYLMRWDSNGISFI